MGNNLFTGGFPYEFTQDQLTGLFSGYGKVQHVKILTDRDTGKSRGIGFVLMSTEEEARAAIAKLDGTLVGGRKIFVTEAKPPAKPAGAVAGVSTVRPEFAERRSGRDRRRQPTGPWSPDDRRLNSGGERKPGAFPEKRWDKKPGGFGEKRWDKKPGSFGGEKKWEKKPDAFGGEKKWEKKPGGFGGEKRWDKKPGSFGGEKKWEKKPDAFGGAKKWEKKPGGFGGAKKWDKKPGGVSGGKKKFFKPGGFGKGGARRG